jgi:hypothetical protein
VSAPTERLSICVAEAKEETRRVKRKALGKSLENMFKKSGPAGIIVKEHILQKEMMQQANVKIVIGKRRLLALWNEQSRSWWSRVEQTMKD